MTSNDDYVFTRDLLDNSRLNLMHHHWVKDFGYLIHPRIPTTGDNIKVADIGCGTGIWLLDAYDRLPPSTQLTGLDISFDATPPPETFPANIQFQKWDLRDPVPEDLIGAFDIINVRFMIFVVFKDEVPAVVDKFMQMLSEFAPSTRTRPTPRTGDFHLFIVLTHTGMTEPGGYLQWVEPDNQTVHGELTKPENQKTNIEALMTLLKSQDPRLNPTWVPDLAQIFTNRGLVDVDADVHTTPPHWAYLMHECGLIMHELIARKMGKTDMGDEVRRLVPLAVEETRKGAYLATTKYAVTGRKP